MIRKIKRLYYLLRHLACVTGYIKSGNVFLGRNVQIDPGVELYTDRSSLIVIGNDVFIGSNCKFFATRGSKIVIKDKASIVSGTEISVRGEVERGGVLLIGEGVVIQRNSRIYITGNVYIEENVRTGEDCYIHTHVHNYDKLGSIWAQGVRVGDVKIKKGCWIGTGVQIMPNVVIGEGAVIGAGSIVTSDIDPYVVAAGIPAKKVKDRVN
jgi:acetyltransferase-like isoleucine patch superfamily enzyme